MDDSEHDVLAYMTFPGQHRTKLHSTNPLERLNKEVKRRADVVGIFPNEASITRLIGAVLLEQNDEWLLQCRYMQIEGMAELTPPLIDAEPFFHSIDARPDARQFVDNLHQRFTCQGRNRRLVNMGCELLDAVDALRRNDSELGQVACNAVASIVRWRTSSSRVR
jgi:hypothetical protein